MWLLGQFPQFKISELIGLWIEGVRTYHVDCLGIPVLFLSHFGLGRGGGDGGVDMGE